MKNKALFLLFIFLASGFLFLKIDPVHGEDGCKCDSINTETGELLEEATKVIGVTQEGCGGLEATTQPDGFMYQNCLWVSSQPTPGEAAVAPPLDLPSVDGLKQLNISGSDTKTVMQKLFGNIIKVAMGLMGSIALALFAYAGVLWMLSGGNSEQATKARNIVVWAVLGLFVIFASYTIVSFIFSAVE